jgi:hypothetical protein
MLVVMKNGVHVPYAVFWTLFAGIYIRLSSEKSEKYIRLWAVSILDYNSTLEVG